MNLLDTTKARKPSNRDKYIWRNMLEHVIIAERALGKALPRGVEIHHVDGNGRNNAHSNLVICPNHGYHALLHSRAEALEACGNADWRKCCYCRKWDAPANLAFWTRKKQSTTVIAHKECANENFRAYKARNPEWVAKQLALRRQRYAESHELRESIKASARAYRKRIAL